MAKELITIESAFNMLSDALVEQEKYQVGSFRDFLQNVWCYSYDNPEYFKAWHVGVLADDIEECLETGMNYLAVLPRFHFKSTILGHAFSVWRLMSSSRDSSILYLSYSDTMARYHISEINKGISRNPILTDLIKKRNAQADFSGRYYINKRPVEVMHGGLFSFKRGMHVNGALIADDILRDPENPLNFGQITKVEDHFMTESMFIPLKGVPVIVLGTPMMPGDLIAKLQEDKRFKSRVLPALDPIPNRRVLMPELYSEQWLLDQQSARPKSFASEFMLTPHYATEAYFEQEDVDKCIDNTLRNHSPNMEFHLEVGDEIYGGFDVGKKRHPSHLVLFRKRGEKIEQVHQSFLQGWSYSDQIVYLNEVANNYNLSSGFIDNTRGELEDRGLDNRWRAMHFTQKSKRTMAQVMESFVHSNNLKILDDERQKQSLLSVSNDLKAPDTPTGHGDAFFSIAMACQAIHDRNSYNFSSIGSASDWFGDNASQDNPQKEFESKFKPVNELLTMDGAPDPTCTDVACIPSFWVPERGLCLYCGYRKK